MKIFSRPPMMPAVHTRQADAPQNDGPPGSEEPREGYLAAGDGVIGPDEMTGLRMLAGGMAGSIVGLGAGAVSMAKGVHPVAAAVLGLAAGGVAMVAAREGVDRMLEQS